ncbi:hypothetical protein L6R46_21395 [Myxococcota bacterium]|nr:hypothetical protein [Myxococcota bacterium]
MLVGITPEEASVIQAALMANTYHDKDAEVFSNRDPAVLGHIIRRLERGYCVAVIPTGVNECAVFSGPTLRFPGFRRSNESTPGYQPPITAVERARIAEQPRSQPHEAAPIERAVEPSGSDFGPSNGWVILVIIALIFGVWILAS